MHVESTLGNEAEWRTRTVGNSKATAFRETAERLDMSASALGTVGPNLRSRHLLTRPCPFPADNCHEGEMGRGRLGTMAAVRRSSEEAQYELIEIGRKISSSGWHDAGV